MYMKMDRKIEAGSSSSKVEADSHVHQLVPGIRSFSKYMGFAVSLVGLLVLSGWLLGIGQLNNAFAGLSAMEANTAIAFITAGLSLWLRGSTSPKIQTAAQVLGAITGLIGLLTLGEYLSGRNFGIDELIFKDLAASGVLYPGRMSFMSALNFTMMGMALLLLESDNERRYNLAQSLTLVAGLIAYVALAGHLFDVDSLYRVGVFAPMAFHTALSFILLFVGIICAQPEDGWVGNLIADTLGGDLLRRLLPVAFVAPMLLGWLRLLGQRAGYYETAFGTTLLAVAITLFLSVIIWFNAKGLTRVDMDRRRAEQNLRASEALYHNLFDLVPVAVYTCDADGLIQEFNHRAVELWGREPKKNDPNEKFCGSFRIFYPDGRFMPHGECPMARMIGGGTLAPHELEILVERPDGLRKNVLAHPLALKNERGEIVGAINCLYDITERKQAEESLRESEERFHAILRQATAGIVRKDAEGKFMFVNQAFCNMLGYTESELLGKTIWQLTHNDDVEENKRLYDRTMIEGIPFKLEKRLIRQDGSTLWVDVSVSPVMDATGKPQSAVAVEVDITGRKQAEEALRNLNLQLESRVQNRTVKLQEANQSLLNEIAERQRVEEALHESRKRLQILSQRLVEVQEEERRAIARELHDSVGQSLSALNINLVILDNQISNSANEQIRTRLNDSMQLTAETISLVRDVMSDLRPAVLDDYGLEAALQSYVDQFKSRYGIKILFEKPDQPILRMGSSIEMTFLRIAQEALLNITRHAHADQVNLSLWQEENAIRLVVQDNGSGIESWPDANRPGSHGLTIMRERAEAVSGNLRVSSLPGKGTKVEVSIPIENGGPQKIQKERQE
jgi:two-component system C4-dicarboxylate transport sensor histidine kinase DctB